MDEVLLGKAAIIERCLIAMVGFRNIAVHAYQDIDIGILRHILVDGVSDLAVFARHILQEALP
jgi:uncharacterized protein YutE (UPF0331/DUF86 family)